MAKQIKLVMALRLPLTYATLHRMKIIASSEIRTLPSKSVPDSNFKIYHSMSTIAKRCQQLTDGHCITFSIQLCAQHNKFDAAHHTGLTAAAETYTLHYDTLRYHACQDISAVKITIS